MTDYEHIVISAVRYALGRMTYIVELTVNYVLEEIEKNKLPNGIKEGDILQKINGKYNIDKVKTQEVKNNIKDKMNKIWE